MHIKNDKVRELIAAFVVAGVVLFPSGILLVAQAARAQPTQTQTRTQGQTPTQGGFPDLIGALSATPGCLGVEAASAASGKQVIFAWFENKQAVLNWYNSETHRKVMQMFSARTGRAPLSEIADGTGPIMVIASLTFADKAPSSITSMPVSQIAVELYAPLPGGIAIGGRFAPASVKVPALLEPSAASFQGAVAQPAATTAATARTPDTGTVTIRVVGARSARGQLGVALFRSAEGFPEDASHAVRQQLLVVDPSTLAAQVVLELPPGTYAVAVRHDENMNGELDKNFVGMPIEGYGTSNNVRGVMRAPRFEQAKFELKPGPQTIEIKLIY